MTSDKITCPQCHFSFPIESALTQGIEEKVRAEFLLQLQDNENQWKQKFSAREQELEKQLHAQREVLQQQAQQRARADMRMELESMQQQLAEKKDKLAAAEKKELDLLKKQEELEAAKRNIELEVQRTLAAEREKIREQAAAQAADQHRLKDAEKDKQLSDMKKQIDDLKRKAEQGSQQLQGEVLELGLQRQLAEYFRTDTITEVAKGKRGGDVIQSVNTKESHLAGQILWEMKNTKAWSDAWLEKARLDQREINAAVVVLVSETLPKNLTRFGCVEGVWVCEPNCAIGLAAALRAGIIDVFVARAANQDRGSKMEQLYQYLSGIEFRQSVDAILECFSTMQEELESEKRAMERIWAGRRKQLDRVIQSTAAMYGDLQGIIGSQALPDVKTLQLPAADA